MFAMIICAVLSPVVISQPWHIDLGMHLATVVRWEHNLAFPHNPLIDVPGPSPYYTPFMLAWVLLGKTFDLSQFTVLKIAAGLNVVLFLLGVRVLIGSFTRNRAAPIIGFFALLLIWGHSPIMWSGLFPLSTLLITLPFPSTFAAGCTLILLGLVRVAAGRMTPARSGGRGRTPWRLLVGITLLCTVIILSHPITAAAAALGVLIVLAGPLIRGRSWRPVLIWAGVGGSAVLIAAFWPWFRLTDLIASPYGLDDLHSTLYEDPLSRYWLLLLLIPALIARLRRDRLDPLVWIAVANLALVVLGWLTGHYSLARFVTWAAFAAQIAAVCELVRARSRIVMISTVAALLLGAFFQLGVVRVFLPEQTEDWPEVIEAPYELWGDYDWAARRMAYGDVVLTADHHAVRMIPAYGMYTVAPAYPDPLLPDAQPEREAVTEEFLDDDDTDWQRRAEIVEQYEVDWVIATEEEWQAPDGPRAGVRYELVAEGPDGEHLYRVQRTGATTEG